MEVKVRKIGNGYGVRLPKTLMEGLAIGEGSLWKAENHDGVLQITPVDVDFTSQVEAFLQTEEQHRRSYHEVVNQHIGDNA